MRLTGHAMWSAACSTLSHGSAGGADGREAFSVVATIAAMASSCSGGSWTTSASATALPALLRDALDIGAAKLEPVPATIGNDSAIDSHEKTNVSEELRGAHVEHRARLSLPQPLGAGLLREAKVSSRAPAAKLGRVALALLSHERRRRGQEDDIGIAKLLDRDIAHPDAGAGTQ